MSNNTAWVTLATNDSYCLGALVLAHSLRKVNTVHQLAILITPGVTQSMRQQLCSVFNVVKEVDVMDSRDDANLALMARPDLGITFTKLHCWNLTQFNKCVFLDADVLVVQNCDELFEREELSAAPDVGWPDCFNSGVFVFVPSKDTFKALVEFAVAKGSFDGGDQGLLNMYFSDWATKDIKKHLPFIYNMVSTATYTYLPAYNVYGSQVKIVHFIGSNKPWLQGSTTLPTVSGYLNSWWNIFNTSVAKSLTTDMAGLAGALAAGERTQIEEVWRRQNWEQGIIDFMGRDSFDNIWKKITETVGTAPVAPPQLGTGDKVPDLSLATAPKPADVPPKEAPPAPASKPEEQPQIPKAAESVPGGKTGPEAGIKLPEDVQKVKTDAEKKLETPVIATKTESDASKEGIALPKATTELGSTPVIEAPKIQDVPKTDMPIPPVECPKPTNITPLKDQPAESGTPKETSGDVAPIEVKKITETQAVPKDSAPTVQTTEQKAADAGGEKDSSKPVSAPQETSKPVESVPAPVGTQVLPDAQKAPVAECIKVDAPSTEAKPTPVATGDQKSDKEGPSLISAIPEPLISETPKDSPQQLPSAPKEPPSKPAETQAELCAKPAESQKDQSLKPAEVPKEPSKPIEPSKETSKSAEPPKEPSSKPTEHPKEPTSKPAEPPKEPSSKPAEPPKEPSSKSAEPPKEPSSKPAESSKEPSSKTAEPPKEPPSKTVEPPKEPPSKPVEPPKEPSSKPIEPPKEQPSQTPAVPTPQAPAVAPKEPAPTGGAVAEPLQTSSPGAPTAGDLPSEGAAVQSKPPGDPKKSPASPPSTPTTEGTSTGAPSAPVPPKRKGNKEQKSQNGGKSKGKK